MADIPTMRAKLTVDEVTLTAWSENLKLSAVYSGDKPEDNSFSAATPSASLTLCISNKALWGAYKPGQQFYVDFTPI